MVALSTGIDIEFSHDIGIRQCGKRSEAEAEILKYDVNVEPNLGPRLFATLSIDYLIIIVLKK